MTTIIGKLETSKVSEVEAGAIIRKMGGMPSLDVKSG